MGNRKIIRIITIIMIIAIIGIILSIAEFLSNEKEIKQIGGNRLVPCYDNYNNIILNQECFNKSSDFEKRMSNWIILILCLMFFVIFPIKIIKNII